MSKKNEIMKIVSKINAKITKSSKGKHQLITLAGDNVEALKPSFVPCNVPELNQALGGGFAKGAMHLLAGAEGSGKTALSLSVIKQIQEQDPDAFCIYVCLEPPFPTYLSTELDIDMERLLVMDPVDYGEQIIDSVYDLLYDDEKRTTRGLISAIVWDSINGTIPKRSVDRTDDKGAEAAGMADRALMLTNFLEKLQGRGMLREGTIVMLIAQLRKKLDNPNGKGPSEMISGGMAAQYDSKTITVLSKKFITEKKDDIYQPVGQEVGFKIIKNNIGGKPKAGKYTYDYTEGIDDTRGVLLMAEEQGLITKEGRNTYIFEVAGHPRIEEKLKKADLVPYLKDNPELMDALRRAIRPDSTNIEQELEKAVEEVGTGDSE